MVAAVSTALGTILGWIGSVISSLVGESGELAPLLPLFAIGIAISAILLGVKIIKSVVWGA